MSEHSKAIVDIEQFLLSHGRIPERLNKKFHPTVRVLIEESKEPPILGNPVAIYKQRLLPRRRWYQRLRKWLFPLKHHLLNGKKVNFWTNLYLNLMNIKFSFPKRNKFKKIIVKGIKV